MQCAAGAMSAGAAAAGVGSVLASRVRQPRLRRMALGVVLTAGLVATAALPGL